MSMTNTVVILDKRARLQAEIRSMTSNGDMPMVVLSIKEAEMTSSGVDIHLTMAQLETLDVLIHAALHMLDEGGTLNGARILAQTVQ